MTDAAKPKPGWYVILEDGKVKTCWYLADPDAWHVAAPDYPAVCIEDLLRDAERLRFAYRYPMTFQVFCARSVEECNALIDANIAREKRP